MSDNTVSLLKGDKVSLTKLAADNGLASLDKLSIGLGWDQTNSTGSKADLDASVFMVKADGTTDKSGFIYYGLAPRQGDPFQSQCGSIRHTGDNTTGAGDGDDETLEFDLTKVPAGIDKLAVVVTIYDAKARGQNFGQIDNAVAKVYGPDKAAAPLAKYEMSEDYTRDTAITVCSLYRKDGEWRFAAEGKGQAEGLDALCKVYGLPTN